MPCSLGLGDDSQGQSYLTFHAPHQRTSPQVTSTNLHLHEGSSSTSKSSSPTLESADTQNGGPNGRKPGEFGLTSPKTNAFLNTKHRFLRRSSGRRERRVCDDEEAAETSRVSWSGDRSSGMADRIQVHSATRRVHQG